MLKRPVKAGILRLGMCSPVATACHPLTASVTSLMKEMIKGL